MQVLNRSSKAGAALVKTIASVSKQVNCSMRKNLDLIKLGAHGGLG